MTTKKLILINRETREQVVYPFMHETRKAIGFQTKKGKTVWLPRSQASTMNMMTKVAKEICKKAGIKKSEVYTIVHVKNWIWEAKAITFKQY